MRLLLFVALLTVTSAQAQTGAVSVSVTDAAGRPLPGATIRVDGSRAAVTSESGRAVVGALVPGAYTVAAGFVGYGESEVRTVVRASDTTAVALVLTETDLDAGEAVVTARESLVGPGLLALPGTAYVVGPAALARWGQTDVLRVLREVPGVQLQEEDGYGLRPNIGLRGSGSERSSKITLLEDGIPIAPAPYAAPAAYYFPTIGRMDAVEVRTGASQVRYGPSTTGGVLNLVAAAVPAETSARASLLTGPDGRRTLHVRAGDSTPSAAALGGLGVGFVVEAFGDRADGFKTIVGPDGSPAAGVIDPGATGFERGDLFGRLRLATAPGASVFQALTLTAGAAGEGSDETYLGLTDGDFAATPFARYAASQADRMTTRHGALRAQHVALVSPRLDLTTTVYRNAFHRNWYKADRVQDQMADNGAPRAFGLAAVLNDPVTYAGEVAVLRGAADGTVAVKANNRDYLSRGVQSVAGVRFGGDGAGALLEVGGRLHADEVDFFQWVDTYAVTDGRMVRTAEGVPGTDANRVTDARAAAAFAQAEITWGRLAVTPGLRLEHVALRTRNYGASDLGRTATTVPTTENAVTAWIPGVAAVVRIGSSTAVFGGVHRGFAPPDARPETRPEASVNAEVGVRVVRPAVTVQLAGFATRYTNLLGSDLAATGGTGTGDQYNGGRVDVLGAELSVGARAAGRSGWSFPVRLAVTATDARFRSSFASTFEGFGTVEAGDRLPYTPAFVVGGSIGADRGRLSLTLGGSAVSDVRTRAGQGAALASERIRGHVVLDAAAEVRLRGGLALFGRMTNLTDATYVASRQPAGVRPGLPRSLSAGVRASL